MNILTVNETILLKHLYEKFQNNTNKNDKQVMIALPDYDVFSGMPKEEVNNILLSLHNKGYIIYLNYKNIHIVPAGWITLTDKVFETIDKI